MSIAKKQEFKTDNAYVAEILKKFGLLSTISGYIPVVNPLTKKNVQAIEALIWTAGMQKGQDK